MEVINRKRKIREGNKNNIKRKEWRGHFMNLLGGSEENVEEKNKKEEERNIGEEDNIEGEKQVEDRIEEELKNAVIRMKIKKAAGIDGIPMEA